MLPFLCDVLENLVRRLLRMFIKSKIVEDTVIAYDLTNIDEQKKENQISLEKVCLWRTQTCFDTVCAVWASKKIHPNNISSTFLRSSFSSYSTF